MKFPDDRALDLAHEFHEQNRRMRSSGFYDFHQQIAADFVKMLDSVTTSLTVTERVRSVMADQNRTSISSILEMTKAANMSALDVLGDLNSHVKAAAQFSVINHDWVQQLSGFGNITNISMDKLLGSHLTNITEMSLLTQVTLGKMDWANIGRGVTAADTVREMVGATFTDFSHSYNDLFKAFKEPQTSLLTLPPSLSEFPAVEFFTGVECLNVTTGETSEDEYEDERQIVREEISARVDETLRTHLVNLKPELLKLWEGAKQALTSNNPDRVRHFITSFRELFTHVLHLLSPDDNLRKWSTSPNDFANNRPTRRARLCYISRGINHGAFTAFIEKDVAATLAICDLFQAGTHGINSSFNEAQLFALKNRAESAICFMLTITDAEQQSSEY